MKLENGKAYFAIKAAAQNCASELIDVASALNEISSMAYSQFDNIIECLSEDEGEEIRDRETAEQYKSLSIALSSAVAQILRIFDDINKI